MAEFPVPSPFIEHLGIRFVRAEHGESELALELAPSHLNTWQVMHGGLTMTLLDVALSLAGRSASPEASGLVTVEMKTTFMQPGHGTVRAFGRVLHRSTTMVYCEGEVRDAEDRLVAKAMGTFKYLRRLAVGREIHRQPGQPSD
ncbi:MULTISPECIES: PaaI family thioesterase [Pandoraea]|uniref:Thioesterase domain-containing protein n=1 Tax=Pandoraea thiooxydans TaxID=445709 RepID=A0A0G3ERH1_9BURK|nr:MULTISPECIES: PaaI family thioesterase [Pandoraea]MBU6493494.1 PaaI family thioesterase [Burkholderiales bacterium]AKJ67892.1 hypothetical protein ABW99_06340 [Pandoraea thiooxydans]APR95088.1 thioesterase family protein [Pandoraea thiooxydans]MDE2289750.1 PaaI family thioesterase [Burkholderiales bacterium]MDE2610172.1 PaaI family thioesterase [Burkholderiales bacterium]